jgi:hypothetical protein
MKTTLYTLSTLLIARKKDIDLLFSGTHSASHTRDIILRMYLSLCLTFLALGSHP